MGTFLFICGLFICGSSLYVPWCKQGSCQGRQDQASLCRALLRPGVEMGEETNGRLGRRVEICLIFIHYFYLFLIDVSMAGKSFAQRPQGCR